MGNLILIGTIPVPHSKDKRSRDSRRKTFDQARRNDLQKGTCSLVSQYLDIPQATNRDGKTSFPLSISFIARETMHFGQCQI